MYSKLYRQLLLMPLICCVHHRNDLWGTLLKPYAFPRKCLWMRKSIGWSCFLQSEQDLHGLHWSSSSTVETKEATNSGCVVELSIQDLCWKDIENIYIFSLRKTVTSTKATQFQKPLPSTKLMDNMSLDKGHCTSFVHQTNACFWWQG